MQIQKGTFVVITTKHPDGTDEDTKGIIGLVKSVKKRDIPDILGGKYDIEVLDEYNTGDGYIYSEKQLRPATAEEIEKKLRDKYLGLTGRRA